MNELKKKKKLSKEQEKENDILSQKSFENLKKKLDYLPNNDSLKKIEDAYIYAKEKHSKQFRRSGEPYIIHPVGVAEILTEFKVDEASIVSAILHDVVEDTETTLEEIESKFGAIVSNLVDGLTKIGKIKFSSQEERMAENFRKMIIAMAKDLRVILIKLADRTHNMRTLNHLSTEKRKRISKETLEIYAPLANRLGIYTLKSELEDLCLKELNYETYKEIATNIASKKRERQIYIEEVKDILETELQKYGFSKAQIYGRPKHFFSIYRKMINRQLAFKDIHDLFGFRIIVDSIKDCYEVLGIVHSLWKPMPGRFKDYIAMPKENLYQSLHTTVIRQNSMPAEIQIRTFEMQNVCEYGIAAHWSYKSQGQKFSSDELEKFAWVRQMLELQKDLKDPSEFLDALKVDLFEEEIFVFTPKGDVKRLASESTALDFAFAVHTDIGSSTIGVKVNGRIVPLKSKIQSGDIVEVLTSSNQKPSKDWLSFVITSKARNKIRSYLRNEQRVTSRKIGKELLAHEFSKKRMSLERLIVNKKIEKLLDSSKEKNLDDLYLAIGYGKINAKDLIEKAYELEDVKKEETKKEPKVSHRTPDATQSSGVLVSGIDNVLVTFSKCCNPLPGEPIIGFITRGRGVSIHIKSCPRSLDLDPKRKMDVDWIKGEKFQGNHTVLLKVVTQEKKGILADVTMAISNCGVNIKKAQVRLSTNLVGVLDFEITLNNLEQFNTVVRVLNSIPAVMSVERKNKRYK